MYEFKSYTCRLLTVINGIFCTISNSYSQDAIGIGSSNVLNSNALLDINSSDRGLIIPVMNTNQRRSIENPANGLLVFDGENNNLFYYNSNKSTWESLYPVPKNIIIPWFGDISYFDNSGRGLGMMKGWAICNGLNNTPDLSGSFIVGYSDKDSDYEKTGKSELGKDFVSLSIDQMPNHNHGFNDPGHSHIANLKNSGSHKHEVSIASNNVFPSAGLSDPGTSLSYSGSKADVTFSTFNSSLVASIEDSDAGIQLKNEGENQELDNRPAFTVMIFIMKL